MIEESLKELGPCLTGDLATYLVTRYGLSPTAARQRISRAPKTVSRLRFLNFKNNAKFVYLQSSYASDIYWQNLFEAIYEADGNYANALRCIESRGHIVPVELFLAACGSPKAQKKHVPAMGILKRMVDADILVTREIAGLGTCVLTKRTADRGIDLASHQANVHATLIAENTLIASAKEWLRNLAFVSYDSVKTRPTDRSALPDVGTFSWDITGPSYIPGLLTWKGNKLKPGFFVCDVLLKSDVSESELKPFLQKVQTLQALKGLGRMMYMFIALRYEPAAFQKLKEIGIIPATVGSLFGEEVVAGFKELVATLTDAAKGTLDYGRFDELFKKLSSIEGALGNMRGVLFELLIGEIVRSRASSKMQMNKICKLADRREAEVDIWLVEPHVDVRLIECKAVKAGQNVDYNEIDKWLKVRIPIIRAYLREKIELPANQKPIFELWTCGNLSEEAEHLINATREANKKKFELVVIGAEGIRAAAKQTGNNKLISTLQNIFIPLPR